MNIQSQTTITNVVELQLQQRYYPIQPQNGVAGSLAICFHGLHPWLFTFHGFHLWLFTLNPAGSDRMIKKIAKRLNMDSHVCNAWLKIRNQKQSRMWLNYNCNIFNILFNPIPGLPVHWPFVSTGCTRGYSH
jgi:hypothetical protein